MDLQSNLIESKRRRETGGWQASLTSLILHGLFVGSIIFLGATASHRVDAEAKPIRAFVTQGSAPPPPPPPPPAPAASSSAPKANPRIEPVQPKPVPHDAFIPPREIPQEVPKIEIPSTTGADDIKPSEDPPSSAPTQAVEGGVANGVPGGVAGGVPGGVVGGEVGGVAGGQIGGKLGGAPAGSEGDGTSGKEASVEVPSRPLRVGGDVKAPVIVTRIEPKYTETARASRVSGVVIVEAIIDRNGHVDQVKVVKGLPMGLSEEAERAVRQWRFKPGTMNGQPLDVIFNLTVNFKLGS
ncbi:MAG TPA: TonB family protein [Thermoanaerobaculia bacterium]|nr:TonB family protein [Thermoanaerobaculia bacterium]